MFGLFKKKKSRQCAEDYEKISSLNSIYMDCRSSVIIGWKDLKEYSGKKAERYEALCRENIQQYYKWILEASKHPGFERPTQVDAFINLAKLYEKQGEYAKGLAICQEAISIGATYDGTKGGMQGRLQRLWNKDAKENT